MSISVRTLAPDAVQGRIADLARLRIAVFREWPYLYDGDAGYERGYLARFAAARDAVLVAAFDGDAVVGMATASALAEQDAAVRDPVAAHGFDPARCFYFGESVLLPRWRGQGIGHRFFDAREAGARRAGAQFALFCAVIRPDDHPMRPDGARSHAAFWRGRGYAPVPGLTCTMQWTDLGAAGETPHQLQFWSRAL